MYTHAAADEGTAMFRTKGAECRTTESHHRDCTFNKRSNVLEMRGTMVMKTMKQRTSVKLIPTVKWKSDSEGTK